MDACHSPLCWHALGLPFPGVFDATDYTSVDGVLTDYQGEGLICWDLPLGVKGALSQRRYECMRNMIEKMADYGRVLKSKKYRGRRVPSQGMPVIVGNELLPAFHHKKVVEFRIGVPDMVGCFQH